MDTKQGERIETLRIRQLEESKAETVVTGCPYCFHMLNDAVKMMKLDGQIRVLDLVSCVAAR